MGPVIYQVAIMVCILVTFIGWAGSEQQHAHPRTVEPASLL
jgi:hypothetical protein